MVDDKITPQQFIDPLWTLHDTYTVHEAAALVADMEPTCVRFETEGPSYFQNEHGVNSFEGITRVKVAYSAITNAIRVGKLHAYIVHAAGEYSAYADWPLPADHEIVGTVEGGAKDGFVINHKPDWSQTSVSRDDLLAWLGSRGYESGFFGFFFENTAKGPEYLDPGNPRYAPKLAAAVNAWLAVDDVALERKTAKQALEKILREKASEYGLTGDDGSPIEAAIADCSKIANWNPGGGAPKSS